MMKRKMIPGVFFLCVLLSGCVSVETLPEDVSIPLPVPKGKQLTRIDYVRTGMSYEEAAATMGATTVIGYQESDTIQGAVKPITINNPYRKELLQRGANVYNVLYYYTHIVKADGVVSDDELTPLVFEKDVLIGKGWDFLNKIRDTSSL